MKLGLVSDTHDQFHPRLETLFAGVDHILHAGDVCSPTVITRLQAIAPVTVVRGNNDVYPPWRETEVATFGQHRFMIEHIVTPLQLEPEFRFSLRRIQPQVVIFGHTHRPFHQTIEGVTYLNPGAAGPRRFDLPRTICLLHLEADCLRPEFVDLDSP